ncbi:hypothetical protein PGO_004140 [Plasmodium gonderi]|uniref:Variable surface protein n=1 Tax=Plasmodium gonderi TaxID=77519 RepID=A0A1Y1JQX9_PLAGO|nr:hypothetical protein PGO_004140 [Plasmodium gonderi]GAW84640.1 hypothetical protein PGO_004140 [Plasmodium gonderi]
MSSPIYNSHIFQVFNVSELPSNKLVKELLNNVDIHKELSEIKISTDSSEIISKITDFNASIQVGYNKIKDECTTLNNQKCCRALNYYLDIVTANIYLSQLMDNFKPDLITFLEEPWNTKRNNPNYQCDRDTDKFSILKRCIIKQIYDFHYDKDYFISYSENANDLIQKYNEYLNKKWCSIIKNEKSTITEKKVKVTINGISMDIGYDDLPLSYNFLQSNNFNTEKDDIYTVTVEDFVNPEVHRETYTMVSSKNNDNSVDTPIGRIEEGHEYNVTTVFLVKTLLIVCLVALCNIIIFVLLYKNSPLGILIRKKIKRMNCLQRYISKNVDDSLISNIDNSKIEISYFSCTGAQNNYISI